MPDGGADGLAKIFTVPDGWATTFPNPAMVAVRSFDSELCSELMSLRRAMFQTSNAATTTASAGTAIAAERGQPANHRRDRARSAGPRDGRRHHGLDRRQDPVP